MDVARKKDLPGNLPASLHAELRGDIAVLRLSRPRKRNALDDETVAGLEIFFQELPSVVKVVVLHGEGDHFSAGLDLNELTERDFVEAVEHSRGWHRIFEQIEFGKVPVVSVMHGAVVGGGLELACSTHVRVAEQSVYYGLPEGTRGIFVGGGGSVRIPRVIGISRMMEMMLTGERINAERAVQIGLISATVANGQLDGHIADMVNLLLAGGPNAQAQCKALIHRITSGCLDPEDIDRSSSDLIAALRVSPEGQEGLKAFLDKRQPAWVEDSKPPK